MDIQSKTYIAHDIDLFFTKTEIMEHFLPLFSNEFEAKKCFLDLVTSLKSMFSNLEHVQLEFPHNLSSGKVLFKLFTDNEEAYHYLEKVCLKITEPSFLQFFAHTNSETRKIIFDSNQVKELMQKQLKSYFLFNILNQSLNEEKIKIKKIKI